MTSSELLSQLCRAFGAEEPKWQMVTHVQSTPENVGLLFLRADRRHERRARKEIDATEQYDQREALERPTNAAGLEVVSEQSDTDEQRDERVDDDEGGL